MLNAITLRALLWGAALAAWLRFGLEPTGWLFYEASFALHADWLYWGYSVFRGGGYFFSLWAWQTPACLGIGALLAAVLWWRASKRRTA